MGRIAESGQWNQKPLIRTFGSSLAKASSTQRWGFFYIRRFEMLQLSRFLKVRSRDGLVAVLTSCVPIRYTLQAAKWRSFTNDMSLETDMVRVLRERKLLITSLAEDDIELAIAIKNLHKKLDQPKILYLMLAQGCNFSCRYCPIPSQASRYGENLMSSEAARSGIILWAEHLNDAGVRSTILSSFTVANPF